MSRNSDRCGIFSWFGLDLPLDQRLKLIKKSGFVSTSVWLGEEEELVKNGQEDSIPQLVRDCGLFFENVHAPFNNCNKIWSDDISVRNEIKDEYNSCISFCSRHGVPIVVIHISKSNDAPAVNRHGLDLLRDIVKYAEDLGVVVAIENTRKPHYLDHVYTSIESPFLGFCYDSSHDFLWSSKPGGILSKWGHLLAATHFSDNDGASDSHWIPEEGIIDWAMARDSFPKETYTGFLTLEVVPESGGAKQADLFLEKAFQSMLWIKSFLM